MPRFSSLLCLLFAVLVQANLLERRRDGASTPCYDSAPGYTCGQSGSLTDPIPVNGAQHSAPSVVYCRAICLNAPPCASFSYDSTNSQCQPYKKSLQAQGFTAGQSDKIFYDLPCFDCLNKCPQPLNQNVLVNSGFETFADSILPFQNENSYLNKSVTSPGYKSPRAYVDNVDDGGIEDSIEQYFPACTNTTYALSFYYKYIFASNDIGFSNIETQFENIDQKFVPTLDQNNTWILYKNIFQTETRLDAVNSSRVFFYSTVTGSGNSLLVDDVQAYPIAPKVIRGAANLVKNPTFEGGTLNHWKSQRCRIAKSGRHSDFAANCTADYQVARPYTLYQNITTTPGKAYSISYDYKVIASRTATNNCYQFQQFGDRLFVSFETFDGLPYNVWQRFEGYSIARKKTTLLALQPGDEVQGHGYYCTFLYDNIEVREVTF